MRLVVVDANVIVKWFVPEEYSEFAEAILDDHLDGRIIVTAPSYALLEVMNALRKYVVRGIMRPTDVLESLDILAEIKVCFRDVDGGLLKKAVEYAFAKGVTVYDAYYIVLAKSIDAPFYTADDKLLRQLSGSESIVKHVREYKCWRSLREHNCYRGL